jgi:hypothetical protein
LDSQIRKYPLRGDPRFAWIIVAAAKPIPLK